ncbi:hypothetical protein RclHR1_02140003 [Rhizophagus clarus]|uniref:BTB/POZ domain-containing protein n=1 Tax=Rhizophagus clarus TaxID=94130 RepID=A0A2Z6QTC1_9GLOM|nr:hypothetical protein RclHR1_02140003 [Rhizophagus clarus]GES84978.1 BTB/POZ domain-containing protein [Rhizophagus clarus]
MSFSQELINDYEKLFEANKGHDVIIYTGKDENVKKLYAHSLILCIRSQYFHAAFSNEWAEKKDGIFILEKPNISPQIFKIILRFIYCGKIDLTKFQGSELLDLLIAVDELSIQSLISCIQEYLINNQYKFLQEDPIEILETVYHVYQCDTFAGLWDSFLEAICDKPEILFNSDKLIEVKASILELLLKRDDLLLDEIVIWNNLIKWGFAQHPSVKQDDLKWDKEEIKIIKSTLCRFIPLIRFYHISSEDFQFNVYPFRALLPKDLINDILTFYMTPNKKNDIDIQLPRNPKYDTSIIKYQHFAIFSSWIEKKNDSYYYKTNIPYHYKLIYRASRDGTTAKSFHKKCDKKGPTIVVLKIKGSSQIIGGYNPFNWDTSKSYKYTTDSFMFSFTDRRNTKTAKVSYSTGTYSIGCYPTHGPIFGGDFSCKDCATTWRFNNYFHSYPDIKIQTGSIEVDDYEVFQVIKQKQNSHDKYNPFKKKYFLKSLFKR